jgi:hypothetical protein
MTKRLHRVKLRTGEVMNIVQNKFEIRVRGQLGKEWSDWFEGLELRPLENGEMILKGYIADQAALIGILNNLHRLNLTILSINRTKEE